MYITIKTHTDKTTEKSNINKKEITFAILET